MSVMKIILVSAGAGLVLFIVLMVYALWPKVKDVSDQPEVRSFLNKPLSLKRAGYLHKGEGPDYQFKQYLLNEYPLYPDKNICQLPAGTTLLLKQFKTYTNSGGSGFTYLIALGEITLPSKGPIEFEYNLGNVDQSIYGRETAELPYALWQDSTENTITFTFK